MSLSPLSIYYDFGGLVGLGNGLGFGGFVGFGDGAGLTGFVGFSVGFGFCTGFSPMVSEFSQKAGHNGIASCLLVCGQAGGRKSGGVRG